MSSVFIVTQRFDSYNFEHRSVVCVFATEMLAKAFCDSYNSRFRDNHYIYTEWEVQS